MIKQGKIITYGIRKKCKEYFKKKDGNYIQKKKMFN